MPKRPSTPNRVTCEGHPSQRPPVRPPVHQTSEKPADLALSRPDAPSTSFLGSGGGIGAARAGPREPSQSPAATPALYGRGFFRGYADFGTMRSRIGGPPVVAA